MIVIYLNIDQIQYLSTCRFSDGCITIIIQFQIKFTVHIINQMLFVPRKYIKIVTKNDKLLTDLFTNKLIVRDINRMQD